MKLLNLFITLGMAVVFTGCVTTPPVDKAEPLPVVSSVSPKSQPSIIPFSLSPISSTSAYPQHIALLLPLQGPLGSTSQAIRNGFLAADYQAKQEGSSPLSVKIYDTSSKNISSVYQQALLEEADFVVGPLSKQDLNTLAQTNIRVPTLALNTLDNNTLPSNTMLFQFGLSPKDEIKQVADKAWQEGWRSAIFITSKDEWGRDLQAAFQTYWQSLGGVLIANMAFAPNEKNFFDPMRSLLVDQKLAQEWEEKQAKNKGKKQNRIPPVRQDVDVIFLATLPKQARQIYPAINFFYAGSVPVFASSSVYSGAVNTQGDQDLNGIRFVDMPWILNPASLPEPLLEIYRYISVQWPKSSGAQNKFYAFGVDAYRLSRYLTHPENFPSMGVPGASGTLYLKSQQHIYRQLQWAAIHHGSI